MKSSDPPVVVAYKFNTPVQKIWNAITVLKEMRQWYFDQIEDFKPKVGFKTQFAVQVEDRTFTHLWEVTQVVPQQKITYNWKFLEYPGSGDVTFELIPAENHVMVKLVNRVFEDYPDNIPEFKRESCEQGWEYFIGQKLKDYLHS
ncbi:MAG: SRPBCC domain-containing protein [Maribacter sp.]|nr:SRPBCC domain-containing protein [Maribacter sp.]MBT8315762.1 SRPBCC domain-containing protein [Maribacter sp.]